MGKGVLIAAIVVIVLAIITIINFTVLDNMLLNPPEEEVDLFANVTDNCFDISPEESVYCEPGTHDCETTTTYTARDTCYKNLAARAGDPTVCNNVVYSLTQTECVELVNAVLAGAKRDASPTYYQVFADIIEGNEYVLQENLNDGCFGYRVFHMGCRHGEVKDYLTNPSSTQFADYANELTLEEKADLCTKFAHKGAVAYCLNLYAPAGECEAYADNNEYLERICGLVGKQVIPSQGFGPKEGDVESTYTVDSYVPHIFVTYTELENAQTQEENQTTEETPSA